MGKKGIASRCFTSLGCLYNRSQKERYTELFSNWYLKISKAKASNSDVLDILKIACFETMKQK